MKMLASSGIEDAKRVKKSKYLRDLISVFLEIGVTSGVVQYQLPESAQKVAQLKMLEPKKNQKDQEKKSKVQKKNELSK